MKDNAIQKNRIEEKKKEILHCVNLQLLFVLNYVIVSIYFSKILMVKKGRSERKRVSPFLPIQIFLIYTN